MSIMWRIRPICQTRSMTEYAGAVLFSCEATCTALGPSFPSDPSHTGSDGETSEGATAVSSNVCDDTDGFGALSSEFGMLVR